MHFAEKADSMINTKNHVISEAELQNIVDIHKTETTFCRRPFTTFLIERSAQVFSISTGLSFILVNFFLMGLSGILLFHLSKQLGATWKLAAINMIVYFLCFSNLFAFFPPIYSYDEPLQYCLIFLSLIFFFKEKWFLFILVFTTSIIARESTVILIPALALFMLNYKNEDRSASPVRFYLTRIFYLGVPLVAYLIFLTFYINQYELGEAIQSDLSVRFTGIDLNFESSQAASETIISFFLILGVPLYFIFTIKKTRVLTLQQLKLINAFLLTVIINSLIVLLVTKAREARLFVLPMFFIWPVFTTLFKHEIKLICSPQLYFKMFLRWKYLLFFLFFNFLNYMISQYLYVNTAGGDDWFTQYLFVVNFILIAHIFITDFIARHGNSSDYFSK